MSDYIRLKKSFRFELAGGGAIVIETVPEALKFIDDHVESDAAWLRTRRRLLDAQSDACLRKIRAATRAFEEAALKAALLQRPIALS